MQHRLSRCSPAGEVVLWVWKDRPRIVKHGRGPGNPSTSNCLINSLSHLSQRANETKYHIGEIVTRSGANPGFSDCGSVQAKPGALQRFSGNCRKPRGSTGLHEE